MPENVVGRGQNQKNRVTKYGVKKFGWSPSLVSEKLGSPPSLVFGETGDLGCSFLLVF